MQTLRARLAPIIAGCILTTAAHAGHLHKEAEYRDAWCQGQTEVRLPDGTRVDCLTDTYAVEIDFARKWAEGIGQAIHYGAVTGKQPATALIIEHPADWRYYHRARRAARQAGVTLWPIRRDLIIP